MIVIFIFIFIDRIGETVEKKEEIKNKKIDQDYAECIPRKLDLSSVKIKNNNSKNKDSDNINSNSSMVS